MTQSGIRYLGRKRVHMGFASAKSWIKIRRSVLTKSLAELKPFKRWRTDSGGSGSRLGSIMNVATECPHDSSASTETAGNGDLVVHQWRLRKPSMMPLD